MSNTAHTTALQRIEELALASVLTNSRDRDDWKDDMLTISGIAHEALQQPVTDSQKSSPEQRADAGEAAGAEHNRVTVDCGALQMAVNVLRRAGKTEAADALEQSCGERGAAATAAQPQPDTLRKAADVLRRVYRGDAVVASEIDSAAEALEAMVGPAAGATGASQA